MKRTRLQVERDLQSNGIHGMLKRGGGQGAATVQGD